MENKTHHRVGGAPPSNSSPSTATTTTTTTTTATTSPAPTISKAAAETPPLGPRRRATGVKRKANNSNYSSSTKRSRGKSFTPLPHINHNHNGPITRARQSPNKAAAAAAAGGSASSSSYAVSTGVAAVGVLDKPSEPLLHSTPPGSAIGEVTTGSLNLIVSEDDRNETLEPNIDAEFEAIRSRDSNVHVIPTPAAWFSWTKVHPIEERALPSFFNGKSENRNSDIYMEIRNSIMKKFHSDPKNQIELKDLSELSAGELNARQEVMEFLDHWGLINFHPFPVVVSDTVETNIAVSFKAAQDKLYQFEVATSWSLEDPKVGLSTQAMPPQLIPESSIAEEVRPEGPSVEYHCNSCSADCSRKRYHCQKQADFDLCSECYNNGKFDSGMSPADFILMEPAEVPGVSGGSWTDQETLLLLEALELFGENWNEIAEHVATKSKAQCILHFVQMPIEDAFLEGKDGFDASHQENTGSGLIDEDSSALKETIETTENESASNNDLSSLKESHETMERNAMINGPSSLNKSLELAESKSTAEDRPVSPKVDASDPRDGAKIKADQEISTNYAINVLKEAFQAVGSEESFAFADAGNPVMALAAFLSGLVKADTAAASARSSVKAESEDSPGVQLALRHCIILENPLQDLKETPSSESADIEMLDVAAKKDGFKSQKGEFQKKHFHAQNNVLGEAKIDMEMLDLEAYKDGDNQTDRILKEPFPLQNHVSVEALKDKDQKEDEFQVHDETKGLDGVDVTKDCTNKKLDDTVTKETVVPVSLPDQGEVNSATTETADVVKMGDSTPGTMNKLNDSALPGKEQISTKVVNKEICAAKELDALDSKDNVAPCDAKEPDDVTNKDNVASRATKDPDDGANKENVASCAAKEPDDVANEVDVASCVVKEPDDVTNKKDVASSASKEPDGVTNEDVASGTMKESNDLLMLRKDQHQPSTIDGLNGLALPSEVASSFVEASQIPKVSKDVDLDSGTVHSESKDPQRTVTPSLAIEIGANTGDCGSKVECKTEKACNFSEAIGENNVDKIKRAALSALSAAAVKAKLLADEEEVQIRRLSTNLIHKQLHKIETKLAFYAEMENAITRAKEQMDRSRQKLYHERAQIIAARLGLPATSSRAMPSSLPINRVAMGYANAMPKSLPSMNSQNSSVTPITNISAPHVSSVSGAAPGSSTRSSR